MTKCARKQIEELKESKASEETIEFLESYFDAKDMEKKGMLLDPYEQDIIQQVDEIADMAELSNRWGTAMISMPSSLISDINYGEPKYRGGRISVLQGKYNAQGKAEVLIRYRGKYFWVDKSTVETNQSWDEILGSDPNTDTQGKFEQMIEAGKINSVTEMNAVFDKVAALDKQVNNKVDNEYLKMVMNKLLGAGLRVIPEMNLYLDSEASTNDGFVIREGEKKGVYVKINKDIPRSRSEMSATEVLVHELVHAATTFAFNYDKSAVTREVDRLIKLREEAMKILTADDLMPEVVVNEEIERQIAEERLEYINNNLEEFLAYALTNKNVRNKIKDIKVYERDKPKKWSDLVVYYVKKAIDIATMKWRNEKKTATGEDVVLNALASIAKAQDKANTTVKANYMNKFGETIDDLEFKWADKQKEWIDKFTDKYASGPLDKTGGVIKKTKNFVGLITAALIDEKSDSAFDTLMNMLKLKPEGIVRNTINTIRKPDELANLAQELGLWSQQVDQNRETTAGKMADMVSKLFSDKLTTNQKAVLQSGLQMVGAEVLVDEDIKSLYTDDSKLDERIKELYKELDSESMNFYKHQIDGLVNYMIDGKGSEVQLRNAEAIVRKLGTKDTNVSEDVDEVQVKAVDKLVTLQAIKRLSKTTRDEIANIATEQSEALREFMKLQKATNEYVNRKASFEDRINSKKGHVRETYDKYTSTKIEPLEDREKLFAEGFKLVEEIKLAGHDLSGAKLGLFVSTNQVVMPFNRHAIRFTGEKQLGLSMFDMALKTGGIDYWQTAIEGIKTGSKLTKGFNEAIEEGKNVELEYGVTPEFDSKGRINNYRYDVPMERKLGLLGMELDGGVALGRTWAHQFDVEESAKLNEVVFEELMVDVAKNKGISKTNIKNKEYIEISLDSDNDMVRDITKILPKSFKDKIKKINQSEVIDGMVSEEVAADLLGSRWDSLSLVHQMRFRAKVADGKLWVRRDMLIPMFGMRDLSLINMGYMTKLPTIVRTFIKKMENFWKEFISLYKVQVIVKTIPVLVGNLVSNFLMGILAGGNPLEVMNDSLKAWKELTIYTDRRKELVEAEVNYAKTKDKKYKREMDRIENDIKSMAIYPLIEYGLYTQILEEVETNSTSDNRIARFFDQKLDKAPTVVKEGAQWLYVTDKTKLFQLMQMATAKSDFVARYAQYVMAMKKNVKNAEKHKGRKLTEDEAKAMEKSIIRDIRDTYINYNSPDSPMLQYMNDMGLILFTKYAVRIQRVLTNLLRGHPIRAAAALIGQEVMSGAVGWDPSDAFEKSVFVGGTDIIYTPSVMKMFESVVTPHLYTMAKL